MRPVDARLRNTVVDVSTFDDGRIVDHHRTLHIAVARSAGDHDAASRPDHLDAPRSLRRMVYVRAVRHVDLAHLAARVPMDYVAVSRGDHPGRRAPGSRARLVRSRRGVAVSSARLRRGLVAVGSARLRARPRRRLIAVVLRASRRRLVGIRCAPWLVGRRRGLLSLRRRRNVMALIGIGVALLVPRRCRAIRVLLRRGRGVLHRRSARVLL